MTPKQPAATAKDVVRVAEKLGFVFRRQRGSHAIYVCQSDQARVVIPMNVVARRRGANSSEKRCRGIIQDLKVSVEEFAGLL